jgi:opacity protein-like surface antigen
VSISTRCTHARPDVFVRWLFALTCASALCSLSAPAQGEPSKLPPQIGYNYDEIETARIAGTSGALRAASNSLSALFINPANIAATHVYHLGAFAQIWPEANRQSYGVGVVDSVVSSARVAGGVGATTNFQDHDGVDRRWTDIRFALAYPVSDQFFLGLGGRYMWLVENGDGPLGTSLASSGLPNSRIVRGFALDAGVTFKPSEHFALSVVGNDLNNPGHGFQPTTVGGGASLSFGDFGGEADLVADFTTWDRTALRAMAGLEGLFADHLEVRLGYRYDDGAKSHALSAGLGYIERNFDFDLSVRHTVVGESATAIVVGFTYHLDATGLAPSPGEGF